MIDGLACSDLFWKAHLGCSVEDGFEAGREGSKPDELGSWEQASGSGDAEREVDGFGMYFEG